MYTNLIKEKMMLRASVFASLFFINPAAVFHGIGCCVALFIVPFSWHQRPHPSFPSPSEKGRRCITDPNFITTTSASHLYSSFLSKIPTFVGKEFLFYQPLRKARAVLVVPLMRDRDGAFQLFLI